jgi:hypothetical protein
MKNQNCNKGVKKGLLIFILVIVVIGTVNFIGVKTNYFPFYLPKKTSTITPIPTSSPTKTPPPTSTSTPVPTTTSAPEPPLILTDDDQTVQVKMYFLPENPPKWDTDNEGLLNDVQLAALEDIIDEFNEKYQISLYGRAYTGGVEEVHNRGRTLTRALALTEENPVIVFYINISDEGVMEFVVTEEDSKEVYAFFQILQMLSDEHVYQYPNMDTLIILFENLVHSLDSINSSS